MRAWIFALAGLVGWVALIALFPRLDTSRHWKINVDRQDVIQAARESARQMGITADDWTASVAADLDAEALRAVFALDREIADETHHLKTVNIKVHLTEPSSPGRLRMSFDSNGRLRRFRRSDQDSEKDGEEGGEKDAGSIQIKATIDLPSSRQASSDEATPPSPDAASGEVAPGAGDASSDQPPLKAVEAAQKAFSILAAENASRFSPKTTRRRKDNFRFVWEAGEDEDALVPRIVVETPSQGDPIDVRAARLSTRYSKDFERLYSDRNESLEVAGVIPVFSVFFIFIGAAALFLVGVLNREVHYRLIFSATFLFLSLSLAIYFFSGGLEADRVDGSSLLAGVLQQVLLVGLGVLSSAGLLWGTGHMLALRRRPETVLFLDLLLRGKLIRPVAASLLAGFFFSGLYASIPYLPLAAGLSGQVESGQPTGWAGVAPWLSAFQIYNGGQILWLALVYGLFYPVIAAYLKRPLWAWLARIGVAVFFFLPWMFDSGLLAALTAAILAALLLDQIYQRAGLLAVAAMWFFSVGLRGAASLLLQPAEGLQFQAMVVLALMAAISVGALGLMRFGPAGDIAQEVRRRHAWAEQAASRRRAEREKLLAEFAVAQKAQRLMLPTRSPTLEGYELAAVCRPAREVGGDLYDFLEFKNGTVGIAVADVSGKGVPASLYMTLTKGLLTSVAERSSEADEIVRQVNTHLLASLSRKDFVTLALGVLDPVKGTAQCIRAGHNPILWHRSDHGEIEDLGTSGIGLGMVSNRLFDRSLETREVAMAPGDALIIYSDGIPEAMDKDGEEYGNQRFYDVLKRSDGMDATSTRNLILEDVQRFVGDHPASDDVTLVVLRRKRGTSNGSGTRGRVGPQDAPPSGNGTGLDIALGNN